MNGCNGVSNTRLAGISPFENLLTLPSRKGKYLIDVMSSFYEEGERKSGGGLF